MKKTVKRLLMVCLVLLLVPSLVHGAYNKKVDWLLSNNFIHGKSTQNLDLDLKSSLTRAEATKLIVEINEAGGNKTLSEKNSGDLNFTDVSKDHWAHDYIKAASGELIKGYPDGSFRPDQKISQAEFITIVVRTLNLNIDDATATWPDDYLSLAKAYKLIDSLAEESSFNREAAFEILYNSLDYKGVVAKIDRDNQRKIEEARRKDREDSSWDREERPNKDDNKPEDNGDNNSNPGGNEEQIPKMSERNYVYIQNVTILQGEKLTEKDILDKIEVSPDGKEVIESVEILTDFDTSTSFYINVGVLVTFVDGSEKIVNTEVKVTTKESEFIQYLHEEGLVLPENTDFNNGYDFTKHLDTSKFGVEIDKAVFTRDFNTGNRGRITNAMSHIYFKGDELFISVSFPVYSGEKIVYQP